MAKKKFTESEINRLRASSYALDISPTIVHFSTGFKKKFWDALLTGKRSRDIVIELGIDPDILGETRINGLKSMIRNEFKAGNGFRDIDTYKASINNFMTPEAKIQILEQQLAYKDQEIQLEYNISLRIVRIEISEGCFENIITNLPDLEFDFDDFKDFKDLYHLRWIVLCAAFCYAHFEVENLSKSMLLPLKDAHNHLV